MSVDEKVALRFELAEHEHPNQDDDNESNDDLDSNILPPHLSPHPMSTVSKAL